MLNQLFIAFVKNKMECFRMFFTVIACGLCIISSRKMCFACSKCVISCNLIKISRRENESWSKMHETITSFFFIKYKKHHTLPQNKIPYLYQAREDNKKTNLRVNYSLNHINYFRTLRASFSKYLKNLRPLMVLRSKIIAKINVRGIKKSKKKERKVSKTSNFVLVFIFKHFHKIP